MKYGKYLKVLGLAISFPSTILTLAFGVFKLVEAGVVSRNIGFGIFFVVIFNILWLMIRYAFLKKDKP
tara:strand:- start:13 stop:216 length:204 start_codon:yes stop_codon:yes gene_type:complete